MFDDSDREHVHIWTQSEFYEWVGYRISAGFDNYEESVILEILMGSRPDATLYWALLLPSGNSAPELVAVVSALINIQKKGGRARTGAANIRLGERSE